MLSELADYFVGWHQKNIPAASEIEALRKWASSTNKDNFVGEIKGLGPHEMLELLKFALKFVEDGGYGRSPRTPWRPPYILEDSPSCPNLGDPSRPQPCNECRLIKFVPELRSESSPCRFIPLNEKGQTIDYFYRCGTHLEMEEALTGWLHGEIARIEQQLAKLTDPLLEVRVEFSKLAEA
jgi:hypothetical protein